jgi:hypothetical protein
VKIGLHSVIFKNPTTFATNGEAFFDLFNKRFIAEVTALRPLARANRL